MKRHRKPKGLISRMTDPEIYAGFDERPADVFVVYIGGQYYQSSAQIHLTEKDVLRLAPWLAKAAAYLKSRSRGAR